MPRPAQGVCGGPDQRLGGYEADDLALQDGDAVTRRFTSDQIHHTEHRGLVIVRQVHRHLHERPLCEAYAKGLDVAQASAAVADRVRDLAGDIETVRRQVDVPCDERPARADG